MAVQSTDFFPINRGGTPGDGSTGTYYVAPISELTALIVEVSADAGNLITAGTDGGSFLNQAVIQANETTTALSQAVGTGIITFTDEDGGTQTANVVSADANNSISVGTDGGAFIDVSATETLTTFAQAVGTGIITYTDEQAGTSTAIIASADVGQILTVGTDGGLLLTQAVIQTNETTTALSQATGTGIITFTDEDGGTQTANVVSADANNDIVAGTDGGAFVDVSASETVTSLSQAVGTGVITFTDEATATSTANVVSTDGTQILTVGTDGGALLTQAVIQAVETTTSLSYASGTQILTFTDEDGVATNIDLSALTTDLRVDGASISAGGVITFTVNDAGTATDFTLDLSAYLNSVTDDQANGQFVIASGGGSTTIQKTSWLSAPLAP